MNRTGLTEKILDVKREKGWKWKHVCEQIGGMAPIYRDAAYSVGNPHKKNAWSARTAPACHSRKAGVRAPVGPIPAARQSAPVVPDGHQCNNYYCLE